MSPAICWCVISLVAQVNPFCHIQLIHDAWLAVRDGLLTVGLPLLRVGGLIGGMRGYKIMWLQLLGFSGWAVGLITTCTVGGRCGGLHHWWLPGRHAARALPQCCAALHQSAEHGAVNAPGHHALQGHARCAVNWQSMQALIISIRESSEYILQSRRNARKAS